MTEVSEIKLALKRKGLNYKLQHYDSEDYISFLDGLKGTKVRGKIVRSFNEGEVYHWPLLNHENVAPLLDVLNLRDDLNIFLTTDLQVKLKNIVHDEDFIYGSRCFDRKRAYARGLFSGLSYLHGKSLCLMNLGDENVFICQTYDRAVITDFSSAGCSRKITRSRLKVCELYKAPETEKGEFDAMAAEIWASGTLMLDMFLAHMVPWAVIDHNPRRVQEIVDKISLELFQAASAGSAVSTIDLAKFKAFLKCFFRENPSMRITARYASIASFLRPKLKDSALKMGRMTCPDNKKPHFFLHDCSTFSPRRYSPTAKDIDRQCVPMRYLDLKQKWEDLPADSETPRWLTPYHMTTAPKRDERLGSDAGVSSIPEKSFQRTYEGERMKTSTLENVCEPDQLDVKPRKNDSSVTVPEGLQKTSRSCHVIKDGANVLTESSYTCYQSKSLSFLKPVLDEAENEVASRNCSYSSISVKQSSLQKSDLCLTRLFGENGMGGEAVDEEVARTSNAQGLEHVSAHAALEETKMPPEDWRNHPDVQDITENINLIRKCQISLLSHLRLFSNKEFVSKQRHLVKDYQLLLRQEKVRLYEILRNQYALNVGDIIQVIQSIHSRSRYLGNTRSVFDSPATCGTLQTPKDLGNLRPEKRYSYRRAIEVSETRKQEAVKGGESQSKDKLIEKADVKKKKRPFFLALCPGGRVEELVQDDVCETCKLNHKAV